MTPLSGYPEVLMRQLEHLQRVSQKLDQPMVATVFEEASSVSSTDGRQRPA
jgi:hypothetical protein